MLRNSFTTNKKKGTKKKVNMSNEKTHVIRDHQDYIYKTYSKERYLIMNEPPGSGKSTTIKFVMAHRLKKDKNHKLVICIPQTLIMKSFKDIELKYSNGSKLEWAIGHNLCNGVHVGKKSKFLKEFLKGNKSFKGNGIDDRILITTHSNMARIIDNCNGDIGELFSNTTLVIDEAHHILFSELESNESCNMIGKLIKSIVAINDPTTSIWLPTATFFRGDRGLILPEEVYPKFTYHFLPLDEHWEKNINYIESFEFNFVTYTNVFDSVKEVMTKFGKKKYLIYCPYIGPLLGGGDKYKFRNKLIKTIKKIWPDCNIIDLVSMRNRDEKKKIIFDNKQARKIDIILAVRIFDEGSDWLYCSQVLDLAPSNSLRILGQRHGRLWRDVPRKKHVAYNVFLKRTSKFNTDTEDQRYNLSNCYNAFTASLLLREAIEPIPIPLKSGNKSIKNGNRVNCFAKAVPDEATRHKILTEISKQLLFLRSRKDEPDTEEVKETIKTVLNNFNITKKRMEDITVHIAKVLRKDAEFSEMVMDINHHSRRFKWQDSVDVSFMIDSCFDRIWDNKIFKRLLTFGTDRCGIKTFKEFRDCYSRRKTPPEHILDAENLAKKNGGKIPTSKWLSENGYKNLSSCIQRSPDLFKHLEQERMIETVENHISNAVKLAKKNGGKIPSNKWLLNNGYRTLANYIIACPDTFDHLKQEKTYDLIRKERVKTAEKLAKKNGGKIPPISWLYKNGHRPVAKCINTFPDLFSHLEQETLIKAPEEHVKTLEKLAKKNGGKIPSMVWLRENDCKNLEWFMRDHPELISHLKQEKTLQRRKEKGHIKTAEKLAKKNGGKIPTHSWLKKKGYTALSAYIAQFPETFDHLEQEQLPSISKKHIKTAEKLAKKNRGKLPIKWYLINNGNRSLASYMYNHPDLFNHLEQEVRKGKSKEEHVIDAEKLAKKNGGKIPTCKWLVQNGYTNLATILRKKSNVFSHLSREYAR